MERESSDEQLRETAPESKQDVSPKEKSLGTQHAEGPVYPTGLKLAALLIALSLVCLLILLDVSILSTVSRASFHSGIL
jgi:hypothetical protein